MRPCSLDELLPDDHDARLVWELVETWDLAGSSRHDPGPGRSTGTVGHRPQAARRPLALRRHPGRRRRPGTGAALRASDPYRWLCGSVPVNYHMLNDFRVEHEAALKGLLTQMLAVLIRGDLVTVSRIAQDGTRVRAGAGANSFKRRDTIERSLQQAQAHLEIIGRQAKRAEDATERRRAAEERAAQRKVDRMKQALDELAKVEAGQGPAEGQADEGRTRRGRARPIPRRGSCGCPTAATARRTTCNWPWIPRAARSSGSR